MTSTTRCPRTVWSCTCRGTRRPARWGPTQSQRASSRKRAAPGSTCAWSATAHAAHCGSSPSWRSRPRPDESRTGRLHRTTSQASSPRASSRVLNTPSGSDRPTPSRGWRGRTGSPSPGSASWTHAPPTTTRRPVGSRACGARWRCGRPRSSARSRSRACVAAVAPASPQASSGPPWPRRRRGSGSSAATPTRATVGRSPTACCWKVIRSC